MNLAITGTTPPRQCGLLMVHFFVSELHRTQLSHDPGWVKCGVKMEVPPLFFHEYLGKAYRPHFSSLNLTAVSVKPYGAPLGVVVWCFSKGLWSAGSKAAARPFFFPFCFITVCVENCLGAGWRICLRMPFEGERQWQLGGRLQIPAFVSLRQHHGGPRLFSMGMW